MKKAALGYIKDEDDNNLWISKVRCKLDTKKKTIKAKSRVDSDVEIFLASGGKIEQL